YSYVYSHDQHPDLHSFPTRRSSDLNRVIPIQESATGISFQVKVHPRAKKNGITGALGEALKLSLTTPPVEGRANEACIEFFARLDRKSTRLNSSHLGISYAVFCLKK